MQGAWSKESGTAGFSPFTYLACDCIDCKLYATNTQLDLGEMSSTTEKLGTNQEQFMKSSHRNYNNTNSSNSHIFCARVLSTVVGCDTQALNRVYMISNKECHHPCPAKPTLCPFHWTTVTRTLWTRLETADKRLWHPGWGAEGRGCLYEE